MPTTAILQAYSVGEQIAYLKSKGVTFELCSEEEAAEYLSNANNYLRAASYRKLYLHVSIDPEDERTCFEVVVSPMRVGITTSGPLYFHFKKQRWETPSCPVSPLVYRRPPTSCLNPQRMIS